MIRRWRWVAAAAGLLAAAGALLVLEQASAARELTWHRVRRGDLVRGAEVTGTLAAVETSLLGPPQLQESWQFKIAQLAPEGDEVKAGTPVLAFDASELEQRLERYQAEADSARKEIEKVESQLALARQDDEMRSAETRARQRKAQLKVERPGDLAAAGELAKAQLDLELAGTELTYLERRRSAAQRSADANLAGLRNQLGRAQGQLDQVRRDIEQMVRRAPRDGTVVYVSDWRGDKKKVGDTCWRAESVVEVPDLARMKAAGQVHEADSGRVAPGQVVRLRLDAHPDQEIGGHVRSIWRTVQRESWRNPQKVVRMEIELDHTDTQRMRPGMRFRGEVELERVASVLLVPADAVRLTPDGPVVLRRSWRGPVEVKVRVGRRDADDVELLDGIVEGDQVVRESGDPSATPGGRA